MKKVFDNKLFIFVLDGIIFGSIGVYAATYSASTIYYSNLNDTNVTNVEEA